MANVGACSSVGGLSFMVGAVFLWVLAVNLLGVTPGIIPMRSFVYVSLTVRSLV